MLEALLELIDARIDEKIGDDAGRDTLNAGIRYDKLKRELRYFCG